MKPRIGAIFPFHNETNVYIDIMKDIWNNANCRIVKVSRFSVLFKKVDFVSLNWVENQVICNSKVKSYIKFILMQIYIKMLSSKTNIIWTMHNKKPHEADNFQSKLSNSIVNLLMKESKFIIVHSKESIDLLAKQDKDIRQKVRHLPLPNYIKEYGEILSDNISSKKLKLLFVGSISRYKNLENLIKAVKDLNFDNLELTIYGKAKDEYKQELIKLIGKANNINAIFKFVENSDFPEIFSENHILVTPYDLTSSLNSATHLLAFSYQRTVLSPLNGTLKDMSEISNSYFSYQYESDEEHLKVLKRNISNIYKLYEDDYNQLLVLGNNCYEYVLKNNNKERLSKKAEIFLNELK